MSADFIKSLKTGDKVAVCVNCPEKGNLYYIYAVQSVETGKRGLTVTVNDKAYDGNGYERKVLRGAMIRSTSIVKITSEISNAVVRRRMLDRLSGYDFNNLSDDVLKQMCALLPQPQAVK